MMRSDDPPTAVRPGRWALALALAAGGVLAVASSLRDATAAEGDPDYGLFRERVEPILLSVCAQCHAGKGQGLFGLIVHAPGVPFPEAEHRVNYETALKLVVKGKPEQSKLLTKPLAVRDGGVEHKGGDRIFKGTPAHRAFVDFINGVKGTAPAPAPTPTPSMPSMPASAPGQPDFGYFLANVEPTLLNTCARCHAGIGRGQFALITHVGGTRFPLADHRKNYDTVMKLLVPGKPEQSKFLLKPLADVEGGTPHQGGDIIRKADPSYRRWVDFINGVKGPPPPEEVAEEVVPTVTEKGLVLQAEAMRLVGDATPADVEGGKGKVLLPGAAGARLSGTFRAGRSAEYAITLRMTAGVRGVRVRVDGGEYLDVDSPKEGVVEVGPRLVLDGGKPLEGRLGKVAAEGETIRLDGREGTARFLSPADLAHTRIEAKVSVPPADDPGRDDAWLLFDCLDHKNGKFFGLLDGGRKVAMGVIEDGRPRVVKSEPLPAGAAVERLAVSLTDGVAVGRLDGKAIVFVNFDRNLSAARFGFQTHGLLTVHEVVATHGAEEVYRMKPSLGGVFSLRRGNHTVEVDLLPGSGALDSVLIREAGS